MPEEDLPEVVELEEAAEWRLRQVDANPADAQSAVAAQTLQHLADEMRALWDSPLLTELHALCNWLGESDMLSDYAILAEAYRRRIGVDQHPASANVYLRALLEMAKTAM